MAELPNKKVVLCGCHGRIGDRLSFDEIGQFLQAMCPDMKVVVADDLCQRHGIHHLFEEEERHPLVVGACAKLRPKLYFWQEADNIPVDAYATGIVDLLAEVAISHDDTEATDRAKLLLWSQLRRTGEFTGVSPNNLKLGIVTPHGKVDRRELAATLIPHYSVIPSIDPSKCTGTEKCRLCRDSCPLQAITIDEDGATIDANLCCGCGACLAVCPWGAVSFPAFSREELDTEMAGLLDAPGELLEPRILAFTCETCLSRNDGAGEYQLRYPPNVLPLKLPCLAMASPWLMLRAFDMGAQGLALISGEGACRAGFRTAEWRGKIQFVQAVLDRWSIEAERIGLFETRENNVSDLGRDLQQFADRIAGFHRTPLREADHPVSLTDVSSLPALIRHIGSELRHPLDGSVSTGVVPFGKIELDGALCTGCGLCALNCPTDALTMLIDDDGEYELLFQHDACVACGICVDACPEGCIRLEHILELESIGSEPSMVLQGSFMKCRICGRPFAPKAMIDILKARLRGRGDNLDQQLEVCPECRAEALSHR